MAISTVSTAIGTPKDGFYYADLTFDSSVVVPSPAVYVASLAVGSSLGMKSMVMAKSSSTLSNPDLLLMSYANPMDSSKTLNTVWTVDTTVTTSTSTGITYKYSSGDATYTGSITLVKNADSNGLIGLYVPIDANLNGTIALTMDATTLVNSASSAVGSAKSGYFYSDFITVDATTLTQETALLPTGSKYVANLAVSDTLGVSSMVLAKSASSTKPDTLLVSYAGTSASQTLNSVWTINANKTQALSSTQPNALVFTQSSGDSTYTGDITVLANADSNGQPIGVYVPIKQDLSIALTPQSTNSGNSGASGASAPADLSVSSGWNASNLTTVKLSDNSLSVSFDASVRTVNEDANNVGSRFFFIGASSHNVVNPQTGANQIDVVSTNANFNGGVLSVQITTPQVVDNPSVGVLRISGRQTVFSWNTGTGSLKYAVDATFSGSNVPVTSTSGSTAGAASTPSGLNLFEKADPISTVPSSQLSYVEIGTVVASPDGTQLRITFSDKATSDIVEMLLAHIGFSVINKASGTQTQDWSGFPATLDVKFSLSQAASGPAVEFTKTIAPQSVDESSAPTVDIQRFLNILDEINNPSGIKFAANTGPEINVYNPISFGGDRTTVADKEGDLAGGSMEVSFVQGANSFMRLGISTSTGVFKVDSTTREVSYSSDAKYYGQNATVNGTQVYALNNQTPGTQWQVIGTIDSTHKGKNGDSLLVNFNSNATVAIVQELASTVYVAVQDPTSYTNTTNWASAGGNKLIKVQITEAQGNVGFDTLPVIVVSHP